MHAHLKAREPSCRSATGVLSSASAICAAVAMSCRPWRTIQIDHRHNPEIGDAITGITADRSQQPERADPGDLRGCRRLGPVDFSLNVGRTPWRRPCAHRITSRHRPQVADAITGITDAMKERGDARVRAGVALRASCAVASWRDSASPQVQDDLDGLLNAALPFAQQMLGESGEFFPFGVVLSSGGDIRMIAADTGHDDKPRSTDVLATRVRGVRVDREALRAVALVSDVRTDDTDAVQVELEHREGAAMAVLLPYKRKRHARQWSTEASPRQ